MTSSPPAKSFNWDNLGLRVASALVLIPAAIAAVVLGAVWPQFDYAFLLLMCVGVVLLGMEWGAMTEPACANRIGAALVLAVMASVLAAYVQEYSPAFVLLVFGAAVAALYARALKASGLDAAYGVFYLGWPCIVLVWLWRQAPDGRAWTVLLFAIAWSSDIAAYLLGNLLKGPKLWPRFSPNKTWSGFVGGLAAGVAAAILIVAWPPFGLSFAHLTPKAAAIIGPVVALATMAGDLWESALKRRYGVKDAGTLIPGHGGLLDRVDGLMFAVVAIAAMRLLLRLGGLS